MLDGAWVAPAPTDGGHYIRRDAFLPTHGGDGVFSFKQDYSQLFTASGIYYLVGKISYYHGQQFFDVDGNERVSTALLYKEMDAY